MKRVPVLAALIMTLAAFVTGCAGDTGGSSETGSVSVNLIVGNTDVTAVSFEVTCNGLTLTGQFNVNDEQDPPVWAAIMDLPVGPCTVELTAFDDAGAPLCTGEADFVVEANVSVKVNIVLTCLGDGDELLGNVDIDATFVEVPGNNCPRLYFLNAVPDEVPAGGSVVTVLAEDPDGGPGPFTSLLTATSGSFGNPNALSTTYTCDVGGEQTIRVDVSDGDPACDKFKEFVVTCEGVDPCEGVTCDDTGNECTSAACVDGACVTSNVPNDTPCSAGGGELTVNGDFEQGAGLPGWTLFCDQPGASCEATMAEAEAGLWSGNVAVQGGPADSLIKNANIGIGSVQPNSSCDVSFDMKGSATDGGVVFVEFFSELSGGGTSSSVILLGPPTFPTGTWTNFAFTTATGPDVSGGVTVQLKASCGAVANCAVDAYFDNVSVNCGSGGGDGTCQEGVCEPSDLCIGVDCNDNNECTIDACDPADGSCSSTPDTGASCDGGAGTCDAAGMCQPNDLCIGVDCNDNNECTIDACDPADGSCSNTPDTGASCDGGAGTCDAAGVCQPIDLCEGNTCDDEDTECSDSSCDPATGECEATPINKDDPCDGGTGNCSSAGVCVPNPTANAFIKTLDPNAGFQVSLIGTVDTTNLPDTWGGNAASISIPNDDAFIGHILQFGFQTNASDFDSSGNFYDNVALNELTVPYTQDFEGLDIGGTVIGDNWTFFVNVFDGGGTRKFGYGGAAPNGPQICALVTGEGDVPQGAQQLSVYSDYNCCGLGGTNEEGHGNGTDLVETNVFQERTIGADDLGKTFTFIFDAKGGNIGQ